LPPRWPRRTRLRRPWSSRAPRPWTRRTAHGPRRRQDRPPRIMLMIDPPGSPCAGPSASCPGKCR
jgi:hypothetical protein